MGERRVDVPRAIIASAILAGSTFLALPHAVSAAPAAGDPLSYLAGTWACRSGYDMIVRKNYKPVTGGLDLVNTWGPPARPEAFTTLEQYRRKSGQLAVRADVDLATAQGEYTYTGVGTDWDGDRLVFLGTLQHQDERMKQTMEYRRIDANAFERRFTEEKAGVTSIETCARGTTPPATAPTLPSPKPR